MSDDPTRPVRFDVPASAHPGTITGSDKNPTVVTARRALEQVYSGYGKVNDLVGLTTDRSLLAKGVQPHAEKIIAGTGTDLNLMAGQRAALAKQIESTLTAKKSSQYAAEIRAHFKAEGKPAMALLKPFSAGDVQVISAVLAAPGFLSGLSPQETETLHAQACKSLCPEAATDLVDADKAITKVAMARGQFADTMAKHISEWQNRDADVIKDMLA